MKSFLLAFWFYLAAECFGGNVGPFETRLDCENRRGALMAAFTVDGVSTAKSVECWQKR